MRVVTAAHAIDELRPLLAAILPGVVLTAVGPDGEWEGEIGDAEVLFRSFPGDLYPAGALYDEAVRRVLRAAPRLRWIHTHGVGVDGLLIPEIVESGITLTNSRGLHSVPVAETAVSLMMALAKRLHLHRDDQRARRWRRRPKLELRGMTAGIVGLGRIGTEVARRCKALEMRVLAVRRTPDAPPPFVDRLVAPQDLPSLLPEVDWIFLTAALTPETRGMINRDTLQMVKPGAYLINVGRGDLVDEDALSQALREERLAGAGLDVFAAEPLPKDSPLYGLPTSSSPRTTPRRRRTSAGDRWICSWRTSGALSQESRC